MIAKSLLAGAIALALSSPATPQAIGTTTAQVAPNPYIEKISCDGVTGTGFKLDSGLWVSAHHVTMNDDCRIDGLPIVVTHYDEQRDYSIFTVPGDSRLGGLRADCSGYQDGQWYWGIGHAKGLPSLTAVPVLFSKFINPENPRGWVTLIYARFIPGQSGGIVANGRGEVTGIVNAFALFIPASFSTPLKATTICSQS